MRIAIDLQGAQTGSRLRGIGRATLSYAKAIIRNRGMDEVIIVLNGMFPETIEPLSAEFADLLPRENIRVWNAPGATRSENPANYQRNGIAERLREAFLVELNPDVVLLTSLFEGFGDNAITTVNKYENVPTAVVLYDLIPLINGNKYFDENGIHRRWYYSKIGQLFNAALLLAISNSAKDEAIHTLEIPHENLKTVSIACDEQFRPLNLSDSQKQAVADRYNITRPYVMYTGGGEDSKNIYTLIEGYARLSAKIRENHQMVLVGRFAKEHIEKVEETRIKAGLREDELIQTGYVPDSELIELYNCCELFAFPSLHEGFGLPPLEAMACGAAVIAADATSLPEVVGFADALFDPRSPDSISRSIMRALTDAAFRERLKEHGALQSRKFTWDECANCALEALHGIAPKLTTRPGAQISVEPTTLFSPRSLTILLIKLDHLGDFLLAEPAIKKLRARYPNASIDIVVGSWNRALAESMGLFRNIFLFDHLKRVTSSEEPVPGLSGLNDLLSSMPYYDLAIDLRPMSDTRWLLTKVNATDKVGYTTFDQRIDDHMSVVLDRQRDGRGLRTIASKTSMAAQVLRLIDCLPDYPSDFLVAPTRRDFSAVDAVSVSIFPFAGLEAREWGPENFANLAKALAAHPQVSTVHILLANGSMPEMDLPKSAKILTHVGLNWAELNQTIRSTDICVANNSGGAHLASELGLTVLTIFSGHELSTEWAPVFGDAYVIRRAVPCAPCHLGKRSDCPYDSKCLTEISVDDVYGRVAEAIARKTTPTPAAIQEKLPSFRTVRSQDVTVERLADSFAPLIRDWPADAKAELAEAIAHNHPPAVAQTQH